MRDRYPEFDAAGARVAVVGTGTVEDLDAFLAERPVPFDAFVDPDLSARAAYEVERGSWYAVAMAPSVLAAGAIAAAEGHFVGRPTGDPRQLPASFVISGGEIVYEHRGKTSADVAPIDDLLAALAGPLGGIGDEGL